MNWLSILGLVLILAVVASVFGLAPKGAQPVAGTRLMSVARVVLVVFGLILLYVSFRRT